MRVTGFATEAPSTGGFDPATSRGGTALAPDDPADRARVDTFTRSLGRALLEALSVPIGALAFLGLAAVMIAQVGSDLRLLAFAALAAFFVVLLLSAVPMILRRGIRRAMLRVGPDGLWHADIGLLPWSEIAELRIEHNVAPAGRSGVASYGRLGVIPRDPEVARRAPGKLTLRLAGAYTRFVNQAAAKNGQGSRLTNAGDMAPVGIYALELEQPFTELIRSIRQFAPVVDTAAASEVGAPGPQGASKDARADHPLTETELRELDAMLGRPSAVGSAVDGEKPVGEA